MQYHSCVCVHSWACKASNWFDPGVGRGCIPLYLVTKNTFLDSYYRFGHSILTVLFKKTKLSITMEKKADSYFPIFWVCQKRANKHLFFRPQETYFDLSVCQERSQDWQNLLKEVGKSLLRYKSNERIMKILSITCTPHAHGYDMYTKWISITCMSFERIFWRNWVRASWNIKAMKAWHVHHKASHAHHMYIIIMGSHVFYLPVLHLAGILIL